MRASPICELIQAFGAGAPWNVKPIIAAAAVLGRRKTDAPALARTLSVPERTVRARLANAGLPAPNRLLAWMVSMHVVWRLERRGMTLGETVASVGFDATKDLSRYMRAHVGLTATAAAEQGFEPLLARLASRRRE